MATYLQGQADYISQIQPTEPNLAFDAQILQTKQAKYDANHKKVSDLYGSLLNASMTRADNIQARDEFFKIINDDIRRMGSLDFSLDQNVQAAAGVFQSIYTNNHIVKDMVWTKNFNSEVERGEAFKNCTDEAKCGGTYWEEGDRYMQYKKMEFKNATADQALGIGDVKYVPYKSVMKESIKLAKDAGLSVEVDQVTGNYKVTTKNGELLKTPLTALFQETIGKDPAFADMFQAKAYVNRNDWAYSQVNLGEYKDMNDAQLGYLRNIEKQNKAKLDQAAEDLNIDLGHLDQRVKDMEIQYQRGDFKEGSDLYKEYVNLVQLQNGAKSAKSYTDQIQQVASMKNNQMAINTMVSNIDNQNAYTYMNEEITGAVQTLAYKDYKQTMTPDEFAVMKQEHSYKTSEMALQHKYDMEEEQQSFDNKVALEDHKKSIGHSSYTGGGSGGGGNEITAANNYVEAKDKAETIGKSLDEQYRIKMKKIGGDTEVPTAETIKQWYADPEEYKSKIKDYEKAKSMVNAEYAQAQRDANEAAVKYGKIPQYRNALTATDLETYNKSLKVGGSSYYDAWSANSYSYAREKFPKLTAAQYNEAEAKADKSKPLYPQIIDYLESKNTPKGGTETVFGL